MRILLLSLLLASPALAQDPADPAADPADGADIIATGLVHAPPEVVSPRLADMDEVILVAPDTCLRKWEFGPKVVGEGAQFKVTYLMEAFRRRLRGSVTKVEPGKRVEWDHEGNRGFVTRWSFEPVDDGTQVTVRTYILEPPRPLRRYYSNRVKPAWVECYSQMIQALDARISATWSPPPVEAPPEAPSPDSADAPAVPDESDEPPRP